MGVLPASNIEGTARVVGMDSAEVTEDGTLLKRHCLNIESVTNRMQSEQSVPGVNRITMTTKPLVFPNIRQRPVPSWPNLAADSLSDTKQFSKWGEIPGKYDDS